MTARQEVNSGMKASLSNQLALECEAMLKYAFASGLKVPTQVISSIESLPEGYKILPDMESGAGESEPDKDPKNGPLLDPATSDRSSPLKALSRSHQILAKIIAPATPRSILYLEEQSNKIRIFKFLGPVPLIRWLMGAAMISMMGLLVISLSNDVDGIVDWKTEFGFKLLMEELFLVCGAGLGATFFALFKANNHISNNTFDPKFDVTYWIRIILGIVSGMLLAMFIPMDAIIGGASDGSKPASVEFTRPLLALLGGFSVDIVYKILKRLITTVETLIQGDTKDLIEIKEREVKGRALEDQIQERARIASKIMALKGDISGDMPPRELENKLSRLIDSMLIEDPES